MLVILNGNGYVIDDWRKNLKSLLLCCFGCEEGREPIRLRMEKL